MAATISIQAFSLTCNKRISDRGTPYYCTEGVVNPLTGAYMFCEGMAMPEWNAILVCDAGHTTRMPRW